MPRPARLAPFHLAMGQGGGAPLGRVVGVLPDVTGVDKIFSYAVPPELADRVTIGSIVRVPLGSRRVRGWVIEEQADVPEVALRPIHSFVSVAATPEVVSLARFGAWRYAGRLRAFLVAASPARIVGDLRRSHQVAGVMGALERHAATTEGSIVAAIDAAVRGPGDVVRLPPGTPRLDIAIAAISRLRSDACAGSVLVLVPEHGDAQRLVVLLRGFGGDVASYPEEWERARAGAAIVVGTRSAVLAPVERPAGLVVLDAHDEGYGNERTPTWRAAVLARERAKAAGVPCVLVSATPSLDLLGESSAHSVAPEMERAGWPRLEILDRRGDDPRSGLFAPALTGIVRGARRDEPGRPVVAVLNRVGRARLLACAACGSLVACERCGAALREAEAAESGSDVGHGAALSCPRCGLTRPRICAVCHSTRLKSLRVGVSRVAEEFAALIGEPAAEITSATAETPAEGLLVGTAAVLHRVRAASLVIWLDFDQELAAHRLRGSEQALALLARAGRLVGPRSASLGGFPRRVVVQTRTPDHLVLAAAQAGDPLRFAATEAETRRELRLPPFTALALVSGEESAEIAQLLAARSDVEIGAESAKGYLVRCADSVTLATALAECDVVSRQCRVEVDPEGI